MYTSFSYAGHTICARHDSVDLYKSMRLVGTYKSIAAAKAQATRLHRLDIAARNAEHYATLNWIWGR